MKIKFSILLCFLVLSVIFAFAQKKEKKNSELKQNNQYIFLFDEANKNRLLENFNTAIDEYFEAIKVNPKSAVSYFYIASIYIFKKEYSTAKTFAYKAVELQPDNLWYNIELADILYISGNRNEAFKIYEQLLVKYPDNNFVFERLVNQFSEKNDLGQLVKCYEIRENSKGLDDKEYTGLYQLYKRTNQIDKAQFTLNTLIKHQSDNPEYRILLAEHFIYRGNRIAAEDEFKNLLNQFPDDQNVLLSYAGYCRSTGQKEAYYETVKKLLVTDLEFNTKVNLLISGQYPNFQGGQYLELLELLYSKHNEELVANTLLAEYYIEADQKEKAIEYIKNTLTVNTYDFNLILVLFELLYDTGKFDELYEEAEKIKRLYPTHSKVYLYEGIASYKIEKYQTAIVVFKEGMDYVIDDPILLNQFYYYMAESYHELDDHVNSDEMFENILNSGENFYLAINKYSYYLAERETNIEKAEQLAKKCIEYDSENPIFSGTYAYCLYKNKNYKEALIYSERSIKKIPKNSFYLELHGNLLFIMDEKEDALNYWNLSKKNGNNDQKLLEKINNINILKKEDIK